MSVMHLVVFKYEAIYSFFVFASSKSIYETPVDSDVIFLHI